MKTGGEGGQTLPVRVETYEKRWGGGRTLPVRVETHENRWGGGQTLPVRVETYEKRWGGGSNPPVSVETYENRWGGGSDPPCSRRSPKTGGEGGVKPSPFASCPPPVVASKGTDKEGPTPLVVFWRLCLLVVLPAQSQLERKIKIKI